MRNCRTAIRHAPWFYTREVARSADPDPARIAPRNGGDRLMSAAKDIGNGLCGRLRRLRCGLRRSCCAAVPACCACLR